MATIYIKGKVVFQENKLPAPGAAITIGSSAGGRIDNVGQITQTDGTFSIKADLAKIKPGSVTISYSEHFIITKELGDVTKSINIGTVELVRKVKTEEEVVMTLRITVAV